jgi:polyisoprenoid-binding protein YceI
MKNRAMSYKQWLMLLSFVFVFQVVAQQLIQNYQANQNNSSIGFSGEHAGMPFEGVFEKWEATLTLPPAQNPEISATFYLASAKTGDRTYDSTLPEGDWFDIENTPKGEFSSTQIDLISPNRYVVKGKLTLRNITNTVEFEMVKKGNSLHANIDVERLAYKIGLDSDPDAEWVSPVIEVKLDIAL